MRCARVRSTQASIVLRGHRVSEDGCDVLEQNAWLWKIRDVSDQLFDVLHTYLLTRRKVIQWIDSFAPHTKFEVQMRTGTPTGIANLSDGRTLPYAVAFVNQVPAVMGIYADNSILVLNNHKVAVSALLVIAVDDRACGHSMNRCARLDCNVDSLVDPTASRSKPAGQNTAFQRPNQVRNPLLPILFLFARALLASSRLTNLVTP